MTDDKPKNEFQFSMWALMVTITVACVILAFPGGFYLLAFGTVWVLLQAAILWLLLIFRAPIYRFLAGKQLGEDDELAGKLTNSQDI